MGRKARDRRIRKPKARTSRRAARGDASPDPNAIFKTIAEGTAGLAGATSVEAEVYASSVCVAMRPGLGMDAVTRAAFSMELIAHLRQRRTPDIVAALLGLSVVAGQPLGDDAAAAAQALVRQGVKPPAWANEIGRARIAAAWLATDEFGDQDFLAIGFTEAGGGAHTMTALIDHNIGGIVKDLMVAPDGVDRLLATWHAVPDNDLEAREIPAEEAAGRLRDALNAYDETFDPPSTDAVAFHRQFALARLAQMPTPLRRSEPKPMSERDRTKLVKEFLASQYAPRDATVEHLARALVDFKADYADGDPMRWSPIVVEVCLLDWFPRKMALDADEVGALPDIVRGWARFAGERRGLSPRGIEETIAAVNALAPEFATAMADDTRAGPAKALFGAMVADGVDVTDQSAIDGWIADFNQRPMSERDAVLGPPRGSPRGLR
ncbi:MAG: hypothetical protein ACR2K4_00330 [Candidatus Limnocylindria bacterium]